MTKPPLAADPAFRDSHYALLRKVAAGSSAVDAIVVAATRSAERLTVAADLGEQLDALVVVMCSRAATSGGFARLSESRPNLRWLAIDLPTDYYHPLFDFQTSKADEVKAGRLGDLSTKRNLGLALAKLMRWKSVLFLDDDIEGIEPVHVARAASALGELRIVGLEVADYPDNSVVCHANRLAGSPQQTFISGSALLVDADRINSFFPEIYNEDWLFFFDAAQRGQIGRVGNVTQLPYDPFADVSRATDEEFGDVFAEGLMELAHVKCPRSAAEDPHFWRRFLVGRARFIDSIGCRLASGPVTDIERRALTALAASSSRLNAITPSSCAAYFDTWSADLTQWKLRLSDLPIMTTITSALDFLELSTADHSSHAGKSSQRTFMSSVPLEATPAHQVTELTELVAAAKQELEGAASTTRIALTAQIDAPYRRLQAGDWTRLNRETFIGEGCDIGHFSLIGEEVYLGEGTIIDAYCMVEGGVTLGKNVLLTHRASVEAKAKIGDNCIIGGTLICEKSRIGDNCRVFGNLIHRQLDPTIDWDAEEAEEPAPQLADNVFVGWGATIIGGVNIGEGSYICAGATVTKDVPPHHIVTGTNKLHTPQEWNGALAKSPFFA
ncbi:MAG: hypothetical protein QOI21_1364 [Actinomycetota bacterium]|nr:hypothetical protein [Actinomycetota bacterium]